MYKDYGEIDVGWVDIYGTWPVHFSYGYSPGIWPLDGPQNTHVVLTDVNAGCLDGETCGAVTLVSQVPVNGTAPFTAFGEYKEMELNARGIMTIDYSCRSESCTVLNYRITEVPEAETWILLAVGIIALLWRKINGNSSLA